MKKTMKVVFVLAMVMTIVLSISTFTLATDPKTVTITPSSDFDDIGGRIIGGIQSIGTIISIGVLVVLGIKYMLGSTEEKAEYKKTMIPYLIGAVLIFAAANIASMVYNFANTVG